MTLPTFDPSGKIAVITGASAGIGRALTLALIARGVTVHALGRSAAGLAETRQQCRESDRLYCHEASVTDAALIEKLFASIVARHAGVDLLVNNAAVYPHWQLGDSQPEDWGNAAAINLVGVANCCRAAIRTFPKERTALILNAGSFAYLAPGVGDTLYCATKAGVSALTKALGVELAATRPGLVVNEWMPGIYKTAMSNWTGDDPALAGERLFDVWRQSVSGAGGRRFEGGVEWLPPLSRKERVKQLAFRMLGRGRNG